MKICRKNNAEYFIIIFLIGRTIRKRLTTTKLRADVHLSEESEEYKIFAIVDEHENENFESKFEGN